MNSIAHFASLIRALFRKPGFALAVILTLTIGIGANTATLSLLYGYLLAPLPYPHAGQLVSVHFTSKEVPGNQGMSYTTYFDLRKQTTAMSDAGMYQLHNLNLMSGPTTVRLRGAAVSASIFQTLGVRPLVGRVFGGDANQVGAAGQVVLSYSLWSRLFSRDPTVIGRVIRLNATAYTVVGVMPRNFTFPDTATDLWFPQTFGPFAHEPDNVTAWAFTMIARLKPGATAASLAAQAQTVLDGEIAHFPDASAVPQLKKMGMRIRVAPLRGMLLGALGHRLILVQLATGLLLILVWFNLANLFIARALNRRSELVLRRVFGADEVTLFRRLFLESLLLCICGAVAGLILGEVLIRVFLHNGFSTSQLAFPMSEWGAAVGTVAVLAVLSALVFSLAGLYFIHGQDLAQPLRESDAHTFGGRSERRTRGALVVAQLAFACVLIGVGAMLARSLIKLNDVNLGFQPAHVVTFQIHLPSTHNERSGPLIEAKLARLDQELARVPGAESITLTSDVPFDGGTISDTAFPYPYGGEHSPSVFPVVTDPGYFETFGTPILVGRLFTPQDASVTEGLAVMDVTAAKALFGTTDAVGHQFSFGGPNATGADSLFRVIGVVASTRRTEVSQDEQRGSVYIDREQVLRVNRSYAYPTWYVAVRTTLATGAILPALQHAVAQTLPEVSIYDVRTMDQRLANQLAPRRGLMTLVLMFALGALLLAAVGLYAVQSYSVSQRLREFGIRAALGADRGKLLALVMREIAKLLVIGLVVGLIGVVLLGHVFSAALYDVSFADPVSLFLVFVILSFTALLAGWIPAWRASGVPPMTALRDG